MRLLLLVFLFVINSYSAQNEVKWSASYSKETSEILIKAKIEKNWHLYSQYVSPNAGPVPTTIKITKNKKVKLKGKPKEENVHAMYDENFMAHIAVFDDYAVFRQKVKLKKTTELEISINFMVCDKTRCLPPKEEKFIIKLEK
ncbi:MAG: protein-disulfide reductase DsbD domain-containing protein [Bacteroidota bacterium]